MSGIDLGHNTLGATGRSTGATPCIASASCALSIEWNDATAARRFAMALTSFFIDKRRGAAVTAASGEHDPAADLDECVALLQRFDGATVRLGSTSGDGAPGSELWVVMNAEAAQGRSNAEVTLDCIEAEPDEVRWVQPSFDHLPPLTSLAVPLRAGRPTTGIFHGFVALAGRLGEVTSAELSRGTARGSAAAQWHWAPTPGAVPVVDVAGGGHFALSHTSPMGVVSGLWHSAAASAVPPSPHVAAAFGPWRARLTALIDAPTPDWDEVLTHLEAMGRSPVPIRLADFDSAPPLTAMTAHPEGVVLALIPGLSEVWIALDRTALGDHRAHAAAHAYAHVLLGHVRPGDTHGHWDSLGTLLDERPHRRWDRDVRAAFPGWLTWDVVRKVSSLDECTALEKARLGLWGLMGEMLGESRRLHPAADRYQKAAYQRHAAQRLVAMLEDYGGAMLCDGVGLGKTYVATTVIVHYANAWRDQHRDSPDRVRSDPFRITVLAPSSVVSTWRREALPPLAHAGVLLPSVRVISHSKLSRISATSELLSPGAKGALSDLEHLLLSDLVIVDEAHNFRSLGARRTKVLRDLLRNKPRREQRRRVVLLTATPINNSLDDLRQEAALLFSTHLPLSTASTDVTYREEAIATIRARCAKAAAGKHTGGDVAAAIILGSETDRFSDALSFRDDDGQFGPRVARIGDYLKEQDKRLKALQDEIRTAAQSGVAAPAHQPVRIAEELLDRIVVQRSRRLCKEIERQQGSAVELLFRPDQGPPEKRYYSDEYDGITDVLARFLPLFDQTDSTADTGHVRALSLKIYMWYDVREGLKQARETSPVVGLQRTLVLKRLESSPVAFLITLLRLTVLHAHRLQQLRKLCDGPGNAAKRRTLDAELLTALAGCSTESLAKVRSLATGDDSQYADADFLEALSRSHSTSRPEADTDDPSPQLQLWTDPGEDAAKQEQLERLWTLREALLTDLRTLLAVTPEVCDIVFGKFDRSEWPRKFIAGGELVDWPSSAAWGLRLVTDAKLRTLVSRLIVARRDQQKAIVFSQFSDTIAYIQSVLRACARFGRTEWQMVVRGGLDVDHLDKQELLDLLACTASVTGATPDRDDAVDAFAPFYRIGPIPPEAARHALEGLLPGSEWERSWRAAIESPRHVLISTDVLAEGVNLQDVALMVNFDVHWNPVRMIQRAGRIDRRLNPAIENTRVFPELEALARQLGKPTPTYYFHNHPTQAPITVNLILPDELEDELQLRERLAVKTLAIDVTLGLEQGTGAEADWMSAYKYQGISSLNSLQKDRAIERVASYLDKVRLSLTSIGVQPSWLDSWSGWIRERSCEDDSPLMAWARFQMRTGEERGFSRYLTPHRQDGVNHWLWTTTKPTESLVNFWLALDRATFPPATRIGLPYHADASRPITADDLLAAAIRLVDEAPDMAELDDDAVAWPLIQGATAIAAGFLQQEADRAGVQESLRGYRIVQLRPQNQPPSSYRGDAR